jgi:hypothetical protein
MQVKQTRILQRGDSTQRVWLLGAYVGTQKEASNQLASCITGLPITTP